VDDDKIPMPRTRASRASRIVAITIVLVSAGVVLVAVAILILEPFLEGRSH